MSSSERPLDQFHTMLDQLIIVNTETTDLIPLNTAIRDLITGGKNPSTTWRWVTRGLAGQDGQRIRLKVWYVGRQPHTTKAAILQGLEAVTEARWNAWIARSSAVPMSPKLNWRPRV